LEEVKVLEKPIEELIKLYNLKGSRLSNQNNRSVEIDDIDF